MRKPNSMNANGEIAGVDWSGNSPNDQSSNAQAFWYDGTLHYLAAAGYTGSDATGSNNQGQVVGNLYTANSIPISGDAFLRNGTTLQDLWSGSALQINNKGQILGESGSSKFLYNISDGSQQDLTSILPSTGSIEALNDSGEMVGYSVPGDNMARAYLYDGTSLHYLPSLLPCDTNTAAVGINNLGEVVGGSGTLHAQNAVLWDNTGVHSLGSLGSGPTAAWDINNKSQVVGDSFVGNSTNDHAFLYQGNHMVDLNSLLNPNSGWTLTLATLINDNGQIAGVGTFDGESPHGSSLKPMPTVMASSTRRISLLLHRTG